nr:MAG TPA: hypothetical protein [Caudoviricetes sp.]
MLLYKSKPLINGKDTIKKGQKKDKIFQNSTFY